MITRALAAPAAVLDLNGPGHYISWGFVQISWANAIVMLLMIVVFALAILLPFPGAEAMSVGVPAQFTTSWADNADLIIWTIMMVLSLALVLLPFIPGLRSIPRWIPLYKVIWRDYYRGAARGGDGR